MVLGLSMYLAVFAIYSISVSGSDMFGGDASSAVALAGPAAPSSGLPRRHPSNRGPRIVHPRNLQVSPISHLQLESAQLGVTSPGKPDYDYRKPHLDCLSSWRSELQAQGGSSSFLRASSLQMMNPRRFRGRQMGPKIQWCHAVGYLADPRPRVALASFPGSGNTWLRYLLQQATGMLE